MKSLHRAVIAGVILSAAAMSACGGGEVGGSSASGAGGAGGAPGSTASTSTSSGSAASGSGSASSGSSSGSSASSSGSGGMSTPCVGPKCDVTVVGTAFDEHNGQTVHVGFVKQGGKTFDFQGSAVVQNGTFTISGMQVLTKGAAYYMNYYADVNKNGMCDQTPTDHVWRASLAPVSQNLVIPVMHDQNYSNLGCGGF